jgi:hypothetical protein
MCYFTLKSPVVYVPPVLIISDPASCAYGFLVCATVNAITSLNSIDQLINAMVKCGV